MPIPKHRWWLDPVPCTQTNPPEGESTAYATLRLTCPISIVPRAQEGDLCPADCHLLRLNSVGWLTCHGCHSKDYTPTPELDHSVWGRIRIWPVVGPTCPGVR